MLCRSEKFSDLCFINYLLNPILKKTALIPARYASTRLPGKMLLPLGSKTLILRTYEAVCATGLFDEVVVVCDHPLIFDEIKKNGGKVVMSQKEHECGTDRIAEAIDFLPDTDIVVNVQGDEPFTQKESLAALLQVFEQPGGKNVKVASLMHIIKEWKDIEDPNQVKVVVDKQSNAMFFSRSVIPYPREKEKEMTYYKHIGIYAFRKDTLKFFAALPQSRMEAIEKLENLRMLENAIPVRMVLTPHASVGIDTPADLEEAQLLFRD